MSYERLHGSKASAPEPCRCVSLGKVHSPDLRSIHPALTAKKQQMQWSKAGAHRLLQTRTKTLDGTLPDLFAQWYPDMAVNDNQVPVHAMAA